MKSKKIVGYWHYGVILTYASVVSAIVGIIFSVGGHQSNWPAIGVLCLIISGVCDAFDGVVARTRKNRTHEECLFGERIDSLSDILAFGIAPVMIGFGMQFNRWYFIPVYAYFVLCALVRLAYFDVSEMLRLESEGDKTVRTSYEGLPVTNVAFILPTFYLVCLLFPSPTVKAIIMCACYVIVGTLYVVRFRTPKLHAKGLCIAISLCLVLYAVLIVCLVKFGDVSMLGAIQR